MHSIDWADVVERSACFDEPLHLAAAFDRPVVAPDALRELFVRLRQDRDAVLRGHAVRADASGWSRRMSTHAVLHGPEPRADLAAWSEEVFGGRRSSIIVNSPETWSEPMAIAGGSLLASLWGTLPPEQYSAYLSLFMGNYSSSAIGIHIDSPQLRVVHLHMGPGTKTLRMWAPDAVPEGTDVQNADPSELPTLCDDSDAFLEKAQSVALQPGSLFVLPAGRLYHVGSSPSFSVGLTIGIMKRDPTRRALDHIRDRLERRNRLSGPARARGFAPEDSYRDRVLEAAASALGASPAWFDVEQEQRWSNLMLANPPKPAACVLTAADWDRSIARVEPFPLVQRTDGDTTLVFSRGRRIELPALADVADVLARLHGASPISLRWVRKRLSSGLPDAAVHQLVQKLVASRGVAFVEDESA